MTGDEEGAGGGDERRKASEVMVYPEICEINKRYGKEM